MADEYASLGPDDFKHRHDAPMSPFFTAWGRELGQPGLDKLIAAKDLVKQRFGRARLSQMLLLTEEQFEGVLSEAGADPYWRLVCEDYLGAHFAKPEVPASSSAISRAIFRAPTEHMRLEVKPSGKASTVSSVLGEKLKEGTLPLMALACMTTACPKLNNITIPDYHRAMTEICADFFCQHGTLSAGAPVVRHLAKQFRAVSKAPLNARGNERWPDPTEKAIAVKFANWDRKDARVCCLTTMPACTYTHALTCAHATC